MNAIFKYYFKFLTLCIVSAFCSSCTVLQYRSSDEEILSTFKEKGVTTEIIYYTVDSLDLKLRIQKVTKTGHSANLLFIHGSPSSLTAWHTYMWDTSLQEKANLYAVDRPGYGYSDFGKSIPSIEKQAEILNSFIEKEQLTNVITIGTSYGGAIAAQMAVENGTIKGVILVSAAMEPNQEKSIWASRLTQWWATRWLVPTGYRVAGDEKTIHARELTRLEAGWKTLSIPLLHLHGDKDNIVPYGNLEYTQATFANAQTKGYPSIDHNLAWGHPDILIPEILKFIAGLK